MVDFAIKFPILHSQEELKLKKITELSRFSVRKFFQTDGSPSSTYIVYEIFQILFSKKFILHH